MVGRVFGVETQKFEKGYENLMDKFYPIPRRIHVEIRVQIMV